MSRLPTTEVSDFPYDLQPKACHANLTPNTHRESTVCYDMDTILKRLTMLSLWVPFLLYPSLLWAKEAKLRNDDIEIVHGEDRTIFEYHQNGVLRIIKIVPKKGIPYYLVPVDANLHFVSLEHSTKLFPQWIIVEW